MIATIERLERTLAIARGAETKKKKYQDGVKSIQKRIEPLLAATQKLQCECGDTHGHYFAIPTIETRDEYVYVSSGVFSTILSEQWRCTCCGHTESFKRKVEFLPKQHEAVKDALARFKVEYDQKIRDIGHPYSTEGRISAAEPNFTRENRTRWEKAFIERKEVEKTLGELG